MSQEVWAQGRSEPLPASRSRGARGLWALIKSSGTLPRPAGTAHSPLQGAVRAGAWWLDGSQNQGPTLGEEQTGRHLKAQGGRGATPTKPLSQSPVWPQTQMGLAETAGCGRPAPGRPRAAAVPDAHQPGWGRGVDQDLGKAIFPILSPTRPRPPGDLVAELPATGGLCQTHPSRDGWTQQQRRGRWTWNFPGPTGRWS